MSDERREVTLSGFALFFVTVSSISQCSMSHDVDRLADSANMRLCIEAVRVGVEAENLPKGCQFLKGDEK